MVSLDTLDTHWGGTHRALHDESALQEDHLAPAGSF